MYSKDYAIQRLVEVSNTIRKKAETKGFRTNEAQRCDILIEAVDNGMNFATACDFVQCLGTIPTWFIINEYEREKGRKGGLEW